MAISIEHHQILPFWFLLTVMEFSTPAQPWNLVTQQDCKLPETWGNWLLAGISW
jgi:hypothetical protein